MDDWPIIAENPNLDGVKHIGDFFTSGVWNNSGIPGDQDDFLYRPVFLLALLLGNTLSGGEPFGFHILNLSLHSINTLLVFFLVLKLGSGNAQLTRSMPPPKTVPDALQPPAHLFSKETIPALFAALVFAVHPTHTESVSWIAGITDPLVTLFLLGAFLCYLKFQDKNQYVFFGLSMLLFCLALLSKETAVMFPFLIITYTVIYSRNIKDRLFLTNLSISILMLIAYFIVRKIVLGTGIALSGFSFSGLVLVFEFFAEYIKLLFVPWPINYYYTVPEQGILQLWGAIVCLALIVPLVTLIAKRGFKDKIIFFAITWVILTLLPSLSLAFHENPNFSVRFLYLPSAGLSLMLPCIILPAYERHKNVTLAVGACTLLVLSGITIKSNQIWQNEEVFYQHAREVTPEHAGPVSGLAKYYQRNKQDQKAIIYYLKTVALGNKMTKVAAYENIGLIYGLQGDAAQSTTYYTKAYKLAPNRSTVLVGLGNNAWSRKDYRSALSYYEKALDADKNNYQAAYNLAVLYRDLGDMNKAAFYQQQAARIKGR